MIHVKNVNKTIHHTPILHNIDFEVSRGEIFGIIGPNGSGKSTLIHLLSGIDTADTGEIWLNQKRINQYTRKQLARWLGVLQQDMLPPVGFTVKEIVEMGRFPFQNWLGGEQEDPTVYMTEIFQKMALSEMLDRPLEQLSGGERQRVALAKVMVQQPQLLLLDEPTTFLDIGHQIQMLDIIKHWQKEEELTVVAVLHDLNLAAQYCDRLLVMQEGRVIQIGTPKEIINSTLIKKVYGIEPFVLPHPVTQSPQILLQPGVK